MPDVHILLLRHGQTDSNAGGILQGHLPTPLNALGHLQAERLAARLATWAPPIDVLVTSDLRRAVETAAPLERDLALEATCDAAWRERGFGSFEGRTIGDTEIWRAASGTLDPPGAESLDDLRARVLGALAALVERHPRSRRVAVVTHGGVIRTALQLLADGGLPLADGHAAIEVGPILNGSILHLVASRADSSPATAWRVIRVNDVDHLHAADVSSLDAV